MIVSALVSAHLCFRINAFVRESQVQGYPGVVYISFELDIIIALLEDECLC